MNISTFTVLVLVYVLHCTCMLVPYVTSVQDTDLVTSRIHKNKNYTILYTCNVVLVTQCTLYRFTHATSLTWLNNMYMYMYFVISSLHLHVDWFGHFNLWTSISLLICEYDFIQFLLYYMYCDTVIHTRRKKGRSKTSFIKRY